jgi:hypothetical protein
MASESKINKLVSTTKYTSVFFYAATASVLLKTTSQIPWIYINNKCLKQTNPVKGGKTTARHYIKLTDQVSPSGNASDLYM